MFSYRKTRQNSVDFSLSSPKTPKLFPNDGPLLVQPFKTLGEAIKVSKQANFQSFDKFIPNSLYKLFITDRAVTNGCLATGEEQLGSSSHRVLPALRAQQSDFFVQCTI